MNTNLDVHSESLLSLNPTEEDNTSPMVSVKKQFFLSDLSTSVDIHIEKLSSEDLQHSTKQSDDSSDSDVLPSQKDEIFSFEDELASHPYRNLIFSKSIQKERFYKYLQTTYEGYLYSVKKVKKPSEKLLKSREVTLDPKEPGDTRKTLVLDLDDTLVNVCRTENPVNQDCYIDLPMDNGETFKCGFKIRPYTMHFLQEMSKYYEILVFSASLEEYASQVTAALDPEGKYIKGYLSRSSCLQTKNGYYIKDLSILKNRDLKDIIIVDNLVVSFAGHIDNGIPILDWNGEDAEDKELLWLCQYLIKASSKDDVREYNRNHLKLFKLQDHSLAELLSYETPTYL